MTNLTESQKKELRNIIEETAFPIYNDIVVAKEDIAKIAKSVKETFGVEKKDFNKLLKVFAESSYNEVKAESEYFFNLYERILG